MRSRVPKPPSPGEDPRIAEAVAAIEELRRRVAQIEARLRALDSMPEPPRPRHVY